MSDLEEVIARWRAHLKAIPQQGITAIDAATLGKFLDAAEANEAALIVLRDERDTARLKADLARDAGWNDAMERVGRKLNGLGLSALGDEVRALRRTA